LNASAQTSSIFKRASIKLPPAVSAIANAQRPQLSTPEQQLANMKRLYTDIGKKAKRYKDYREMLEKQKDIDAVVVATSDHMHTPIALAAMELGKHVYVQKAPHLVGRGSARTLPRKPKKPRSPRKWAIKAILLTKLVSPSNTFSPAPSAKS